MSSQKLLELVMIVKNSGEILRECLQKNRNFIDHWTIVDTGSTDNTPDIIREELRDIPGTLHFSEFTNFSETRNKAFELADKKCKYMIVLDDSYEIGNGKEMREYLQKSNADVIQSKIAFKRDAILTDLYYSNRITKSSLGLRYKFRVHEILDIPDKIRRKRTDTVDEKTFYIIDHTNKEHGSRTQARNKRDIEHLLLDLNDYPKEPRLLYYLAVTSFNLVQPDEAIKYLTKLLDMTNIKEYTYYAEYNLILQNYIKTDDRATYQKKLMNLQQRYLDRAEPTYKLAVSFYEEGQLDKINAIMDRLIQVPLPQLSYTILEHDVYEYQIPYLYCEVKFKMGLIEKGVTVLKNLLAQHPSDQKLLNMKYAICDNLDKGHARLAPKTLVIHTGEIHFTWNPALPTKISGSEYMAMNMAKEFRDIGYRVFIFGQFLDEKDDKKIDYQTTIDGIQYIDNVYFSDFCLTYVVDQLIVSRFINNLVYYDNVKSVYLWLHDILPVGGDFRYIQIHKEKFKGVICISEWQKRYVMKHTKIDEQAIYVSRNAIHPKRFNGPIPVDRTPFRFVFTSDPNRGFNNFVEMIPWIKERYPQSTFYLFGRLEQVSDEDMARAKAMSDYVFISPRISQEQLVTELKKSDVWLYPTCFDETYCISAVEAMAAGCLVASINEAALCEIVGDRGVMVDYTTREETNRALFEALCKVLDDPKKKEEITERGHEWAMKQDYYTLALDWKKKLF
jgi:glycosyltransferase involved in cell wall biosynthesis